MLLYSDLALQTFYSSPVIVSFFDSGYFLGSALTSRGSCGTGPVLVVCPLMLVASHIAGLIHHIFPAGDALPFPCGVEALLVRAGVTLGVRQTSGHGVHLHLLRARQKGVRKNCHDRLKSFFKNGFLI